MLHANSSDAIRLSIFGRKYLLYKNLFNALRQNNKINSNLRTRVHIHVLDVLRNSLCFLPETPLKEVSRVRHSSTRNRIY
jgi:hypothetical protein